MGENRLIKRARRGDREAFAELFSAVEQEVYRTAYLYVKNRDDALDIVQETAYRCFRGFEALREKNYFKTWAVRTAINCSLDHIRKSGRTVPIEEAAEIEEPSADAEQAVIAKMTLDDLLERLDENEKSAILLKYQYGYTFAEIAELIGLPLGTAKSVLYRAIAKLKDKEGCL